MFILEQESEDNSSQFQLDKNEIEIKELKKQINILRKERITSNIENRILNNRLTLLKNEEERVSSNQYI